LWLPFLRVIGIWYLSVIPAKANWHQGKMGDRILKFVILRRPTPSLVTCHEDVADEESPFSNGTVFFLPLQVKLIFRAGLNQRFFGRLKFRNISFNLYLFDFNLLRLAPSE
jgi:hypothetical protein